MKRISICLCLFLALGLLCGGFVLTKSPVYAAGTKEKTQEKQSDQKKEKEASPAQAPASAIDEEEEKKNEEAVDAKLDPDQVYHVYYLNEDYTGLVEEEYKPQCQLAQDMIVDMIRFLEEEPENDETNPLLDEGVEITTHFFSEGTLTLDFSPRYSGMDLCHEVLTRAGIVKLFAQIPTVDYVKFTIDGQELADQKGQPISIMNEDTFVDYSMDQEDSKRKATLTLYFTNKEGDCLLPEEREVSFNSSIPLERVILEELSKGPKEADHYPVMPSKFTIIGMSRQNNCEYLNFSQDFIDKALKLKDPSVTIYAIVNSILKINQAEKVSISIDGQHAGMTFGDDISLNQFFTSNEELIRDK